MIVKLFLSTAKIFMVLLQFFSKLVLTKMCFVFKTYLKAAMFHYLTFFSCYVELLGKKFPCCKQGFGHVVLIIFNEIQMANSPP